ncbi:hypothetical protein GCM10010389_21320 [Streptomyces echinoruber]|uniref:Uncharacterized protein n=1 Tax=Streptomyces echinoruber TaxID=68898 RepID=A0A918R5M9_9ACTN|nr:hypothetical protein GCM10010389_21320 [Streptomyces echinoruber]
MHKIRYGLWTTGAAVRATSVATEATGVTARSQASWAVRNIVMITTTVSRAAQVPYCTSARRSRGACTMA